MGGLKYKGKLINNEIIELILKDRRIQSVKKLEGVASDKVSYITPGFIDLQVNGFNGIDYNDPNLTIEKIEHSFKALLKQGTTNLLVTLITNDIQSICNQLQTFENACKNSKLINSMLLGYHIEGPFISEKDGARGAHNKNFIKDPTIEDFMLLHKASNKRIKIITLAPERKGIINFLKKCNSNGIITSIGHSNASSEDLEDAIKAGLTMSTHLGNGCSSMIHRHNNIIYDQLVAEQLWAGLIGDGFHLPKNFLKIILKQKNNKVCFVSDTTSLGNMPAGNYTSHVGGDVTLTKKGKLHVTSNEELLAGSAQSLISSLNNIVINNILDLEKTLKFMTETPAILLKNNTLGAVKKDNLANLNFISHIDGKYILEDTILNGDSVNLLL